MSISHIISVYSSHHRIADFSLLLEPISEEISSLTFEVLNVIFEIPVPGFTSAGEMEIADRREGTAKGEPTCTADIQGGSKVATHIHTLLDIFAAHVIIVLPFVQIRRVPIELGVQCTVDLWKYQNLMRMWGRRVGAFFRAVLA